MNVAATCAPIARAGPGRAATCTGPPLVPSAMQQLHGAILPAALRAQFILDENDSFALDYFAVRVGPDVVICERNYRGVVDVIVFQYHSLGVSKEEHVSRICAVVARHYPSFVLVLTCWTDPASQVAALQRLAHLHPQTTIVSYCRRELSAQEGFERAWPYLRDAVLFPSAKPLFFFYRRSVRLCPTPSAFRTVEEAARTLLVLGVAGVRGLCPRVWAVANATGRRAADGGRTWRV